MWGILLSPPFPTIFFHISVPNSSLKPMPSVWVFSTIQEFLMNIRKNEHDQLDKNTDRIGKLIRINAVAELTGLSKSYIYQLCDDDNLFPKSIKLVPGGTSVAWVESEVLQWIDSRIEARDRQEVA
jgi:prophage regulatory protein